MKPVKLIAPLLTVKPLLAVKVPVTLTNPPVPLFGLKTILPVVFPPRVRVWLLRDWIVPFPFNDKPVPPVTCDEMEATGVAAPALFRNANLAELVELPPNSKSYELMPGESALVFNCQYAEDAPTWQLVPLERQTDTPLTLTSVEAFNVPVTLTNPPVPLFGNRAIFPVVLPPMVSVLFLKL